MDQHIQPDHPPRSTRRPFGFRPSRFAAAGCRRLWHWCRRHPVLSISLFALLLCWLFCLPNPLFEEPVSTVVEDQQGELMGARIAADGQWRFPETFKVPEKYRTCLIAFEDRRFAWHPGIDPVGLARAFWQNLQHRELSQGGSTLTMQVIRMARRNPPRTILEKALEMVMATRLEARFSKEKILSLYAAHAPFGGNVVGIEAAAWRYFGKSPQALSWAEAATLAVLPNSPALIHPGRNREKLLKKRNALLSRLARQGALTNLDRDLACDEPLPEAPLPLPQLAPHLLARLAAGHHDQGRFSTTLDHRLQQRVSDILARRLDAYEGNDIHNLAAVVIEVPTGNILAYVGNAPGTGKEHGQDVDILSAPRSTGSILKPYLYALSLESGNLLPQSLLSDVPTQMGQYKPENFLESYDGAVHADRALIRSLNVPFVLLLQQYGLEKFHFNLQRLGLTTLAYPPQHYGLSLILGGAEATLLDVTNTYASIGRVLGQFYNRNGRYSPTDFRPPHFLQTAGPLPHSGSLLREPPLLSAGAIWQTFQAMHDVERPNSSGEWELFRASRHIAWKTGTSYGFRDAWAVGVTPRFAVGVWVGNADGEGRPGLIGVQMAAPILFEIFEQLPPESSWFDPPYDDMVQAAVCPQSGCRAGPWCPADTISIPKSCLKGPTCTYHTLLHLDPSGAWQVTSNCQPPDQMQHLPWFVLSPIEEYYFKSKNPSYKPPPPFRPDCLASAEAQAAPPLQLIYPKHPTRIYVPVEIDGKLGRTVFQAAHRTPDTEIFWHLDGLYLGSTKTFHQMALQPAVGKHLLTLVDQNGYRLEQRFEIIGK